MIDPVEISIFFNFRSPYCYLASKKMFSVFDDYHAKIVWRPFGAWSGRSAPERAAKKIPLVRQDIARHARIMGIPFTPPPIETDPTIAGVVSIVAEEEGLLQPYVVEVMRKEWAEGRDIGQEDVLLEVGEDIGLGRGLITRAIKNKNLFKRLERNWEEAQEKGIFGVPSFVVDDQMFWGSDRIDHLRDHLHELRLKRV